jgi:hypothetical protein
VVDARQLALVKLVTERLKEQGYRYLAVVEDDPVPHIVIRIYKGLDES